MRSRLRSLALVFIAAMTVGRPGGAEPPTGAGVAVERTLDEACSISDAPLAASQLGLLDLAFEAATAIPIDPHIRERSRAQEAVVNVCLELDQPRRALGYIERIEDWRRGAGYAEFACYCARHGDTATAHHALARAAEIGESTDDWRRDRIRVTIAKAHTWLGQTQEAARFEAGAVPSESGKVDGVRAMLVNETGFDAQLTLLDAISATGELDHLTNALRGRTLLFDRFYDDPVRRAQVEEKIKASWQALPVMIRIALLGELAESALRHNDRHKAMELIDETQVMMEGRRWTPEYQVPLMSRLAALRHRAGDPEAARGEAEGALALFRRERNRIANIYRAEALRALAEAYWTMGDAAAARFTYKLAVEAGVENPNSRPRAKDLSATCCSMARHGFEPDAELWARLHRIRGGLGDPW